MHAGEPSGGCFSICPGVICLQMNYNCSVLTQVHSFIHSGHFYSAPSSPLKLRGAPDYSTDGYCIGVSRRSTQATAGKGLAQGLYVAARAGVEPTTLRLKVIVSTKAPPRPIH